MTWRTPLGERILQGTESKFAVKLVQFAAMNIDSLDISDILGGNNYIDEDDILFDNVMSPRIIYLLHWCLKALLTPEVPPAEIKDAIALSICYLFDNLATQIAFEIETDLSGLEPQSPYRYHLRQLCWKPLVEYVLPSQIKSGKTFSKEMHPLKRKNLVSLGKFSPEATDKPKWHQCIKQLSIRIIDAEWMASLNKKQVMYNPHLLPEISFAKSQALMCEISYWKPKLRKY